jgi:N-acetylornithine carbamoyltransferase
LKGTFDSSAVAWGYGVLDRMGDAIAIRCYGDPVDWEYGGAHAMLEEFARWSESPVLNMELDSGEK